MRLSPILPVVVLFLSLLATSARSPAQQPTPPNPSSETPSSPARSGSQEPASPKPADDPKSSAAKNGSTIDSPQPKVQNEQDQTGQQTKRILWIYPNFRSVSASTYLPPLSFREKMWLATQDSFDYSAFIYQGIVAGISMAQKSQPAFGQGAAGYGQYYAHTFADGTIENYMVEGFVPTLTKQDPRYYTLGHGGFFKRTGYAVSRLLITRTDSGRETFNFSEIVGAGAAAGIGNAYYPGSGDMWVKTYQRWGSQIAQDGLSFVAKEFWPDINRAVFHNKY